MTGVVTVFGMTDVRAVLVVLLVVVVLILFGLNQLLDLLGRRH
jgi:hypothetical protein